MSTKYLMSWDEVFERLKRIPAGKRMYGIPRGGAVVAMLRGHSKYWLADTPEKADIIVDDIIDTGDTAKTYAAAYKKKVYALVDKQKNKADAKLGWVVFPWEKKDESSDIADTITRQLEFIGEDPKREGLVDTPKRAIKALQEMTAGLKVDPKRHLSKVFNEPGDEMIIVRDLPYWSLCEHHLLPFNGTVTIAYVPKGKVVGLSKLPRMVRDYARRPQVQERLTNQIADAITEVLKPEGVGVLVTGRHTCQEMRGIESPGQMVTSALRGIFKTDAKARAEFLALRR